MHCLRSNIMVHDINRQVLLKSRPADIPEAENFEIVNAPVPEPGDNEILVRNIYLSVEPAMEGIRGRVLISD